MPETAQPEIFLDDITFNAKDVLDEISQIKSGANSDDQITPSLLKASAPYIINSILYIFSCIISACQFLKVWKNIHVCPHHKNGSKTEIKNYRPTAMLCSISIVFESIVYKQIKKTFERKLCSKTRFGFAEKFLKFFASYLADRHQRVKIANSYSIFSKIPIFAVFLFSVYINDLIDQLNNKTFLYADNKKRIEEISELEELQFDINRAIEWFGSNKLNFNFDKFSIHEFSYKNTFI